MNCRGIQLLQNPDSINIKTSNNSIQIFQGVTVINICAQVPIAKFLPYSFTATEDNQSVFGPLPVTPLAVITLGITGTIQDPAGTIPDYTVNGLNIVLSFGIAIGNTVYGMIQVP